MGAPDSSIAATARSTDMRCFRMWAGYWILPQPAHARLHAYRGSSSTSKGNLSRLASRWATRYVAILMLCRRGTDISAPRSIGEDAPDGGRKREPDGLLRRVAFVDLDGTQLAERVDDARDERL